MTGRPTLQSIAERVSVSRQTVSNVRNSPHLVHPDTSARVRAAIDEVGYRPHCPARQLRNRRSYIVGLRVRPSRDELAGAVMNRFLHAITDHAQALGYRVMVFTASDDAGEILQYDELLDTADIDAFVLTDTHHDDARTRSLAARGVPFATFSRPWDELAAFGASVVDTVADGAQAALDILGTVAPTAFVCASDTLALGALAATRTGSDPAGPSTCAVVGFDDTPVAQAIGLSSVAQPLHEAAGWALRLLLAQLTARSNGEPPTLPGQHVLLDPELVVRNSSTAPEAPDADP